MKTEADALTQWTTDEIVCDFGRGKRTFTRDQLGDVCAVLKDEFRDSGRVFVEDRHGQIWPVALETFVDSSKSLALATALKAYKKADKFTAQLVVQFETIDEMVRWARGEIPSYDTVLTQHIPPVEAWRRPL
jgi:hypothetical protein